jgi:hypothetical protein
MNEPDGTAGPTLRDALPVLARCVLLGLAAGGRSSLAIAAPVLSSPERGRGARAAALLAVAGEIAVDKLPHTPSRLEPAPAVGRVVGGAIGGALLARRAGAGAALPMLVAASATTIGMLVGARWRGAAGGVGLLDWQAAVAEDVTAVGLAGLACRR